MSLNPSLSFRRLVGGVAVLALAAALPAQFLPPGTQVVTGDDVLQQNVALTFSFPYVDSLGSPTTTNMLAISTNGWAKLVGAPASTSSDNSESVAEFLAQEARVAVHWDDLDNTGTGYDGGAVYLNDNGSVAAITWVMWEFVDPANPVIAQAQLWSDGRIEIFHISGNDDCLIGFSQGGGVADPGATDFSALVGTNNLGGTFYEIWTTPGCDLPLTRITAVPAGAGGYDVTVSATPAPTFASAVARGIGCPVDNNQGGVYERWAGDSSGEPYGLTTPFTVYYAWDDTNKQYLATYSSTVIYETGFATTLASFGYASGNGDDGMSNPVPLGFTSDAWDLGVTSVEVNPNGYVYLNGGGSCTSIYTLFSSTCFGGTRAVISAAGTDLSEDPTDGNGYGTIYADTLPASGMLPQRFVVTWDGVGRWNSSAPSPESVTAQVGIFPNGDMYATVISNTVTRSQGAANFEGTLTSDPGESSLASFANTAIISSTSLIPPQSPAVLDVDAPRLGSTPTATATNLVTGTLGSALHIGLDQTNTALDFIGMPGCTAYTLTLIGVLPMVNGVSNDASVSLGLIPNVPAIIGNVATCQSVSFAPGVNPLNIYASNGVDLTLGY